MNVFTDSFSNYSTSQIPLKWNAALSGTVNVGATWAIGGGSQGMQISAGTVGRGIPSYFHYYFGIRLKIQSQGAGFNFNDLNNNQISITWNSTTGTWAVKRSGTLLVTSTLTTLTGSIHYYEVETQIATSGGVVKFYVDGTLYATFTGNTQATGNAYINNIQVSSNGGGGTEVWVSDCYINDDTGSLENGLNGDCAIASYPVNAAGGYAQFSRGGTNTGTNYGQLAKTLADATSYNDDTVVGHRDSFLMAAVASGTLIGARLWCYAQKDNIGIRQFALTETSSGTDTIGATQTLSGPGYSWYTQDASIDVATGVLWASLAALNAAYWGYKIIT